GLFQSSFLPPKWATMDHNLSMTDPDIEGTGPDHLGLVFWCKICCTNISHMYLYFHYSGN
ncbi:hypothetical protein K443DRAFT_98455, partial [Laccaria amethystina LaAM-08-1]